MKKIAHFFNAVLLMITLFSSHSVYAEPPVPGNWQLTFEENFDGNSLDPKKWTTGGASFNGTGGNSPDTISIQNGNVQIKAEKRPLLFAGENHDYVASEITTFQKFTQKYGYFEARLKYDAVIGVWPAFWTLPDRGNYGNPDKNHETYLKFDLSSLDVPVTSAKLKIMVTAFTNSTDYSDVSVHRLVDNNWNESSITWNTKPDFDPAWLALFYASTNAGEINEINQGEYLIIDVTDYINTQIASFENAGFALADLSMRSNLITFGSKEAANEADRPRLEIEIGVGSNNTNIFTSDDAFVRAGAYADNNYGSEVGLEVQDPWASTSSTLNGGMEVDIMESLGVWGDNVTFNTVHWGGYAPGHPKVNSGRIDITPTADGYHVYAMNWQPGRIDFYIDDQPTWTFENPNVGSVESYILLTQNLGGWDWSGNQIIDDANLPASLYVDYVRVYQYIPTENKITQINGPSLVAQEEAVTVSVSYEVTTARDITAVFKLNEAPFTEYSSLTKSVAVGLGSKQFSLTIPLEVPVGANYSYQVYITPTGGNWDNRLSDMSQASVEVVQANSNDKINSVNGPSQVSQGEMITVTVDYGALDDRDINAVLQLNEPPWTAYGSGTTNVSAGVGTVDIAFTVDSSAPEGINYQYQTIISPLGGDWNSRFNNKSQAPVTVKSTDNSEDKINIVSGSALVSQGETITVAIDYEATTNRDLRFIFQLNEAPWTQYYAEVENVSAGVGTAEFTFTVPQDLPVGANYFYFTMLTTTGGTWNERFDYERQQPITVTGVSNSIDEINPISGPTSVSQGETTTVFVDYKASTNRDLRFIFQLNEAPWTQYYAEVKNVSAGVGTAKFTFTVPQDLPVGANYFYFTMLTTTGGSWNERFDYERQQPITVTSN